MSGYLFGLAFFAAIFGAGIVIAAIDDWIDSRRKP